MYDSTLPTPAPTDRGDLRILLGAAPGVGKTYAMLNEGRRLLAEGKDVVIGYVETHGRVETEAQIAALEIIPRRVVQHGALDVTEMDVPAILARQPDIVLVDELAHTNAIGSERAKRYQDVDVLRDHGIDVITTVNIQHLAELQDVVASITGVQVRESIPDQVLTDATDVQLVDLPIEVLLNRLEQGKIYAPDPANRALTNFFKEGNLTALRELALRRTAEGVDDQLSRMMLGPTSTSLTTERVLVLISPNRSWTDVLRNAWRLASALRGELLILSLAPTGDLTHLPPQEREVLEAHYQLARDLGGRILIQSDQSGSRQDRAQAIATTVQQERVTILVGGIHHSQGRFRSSWDGLELLTDAIQLTDGVDLHLVQMRA